MSFLEQLKLEPSEETIQGISSKVKIHRFSWRYFEQEIVSKLDSLSTLSAALIFLHPEGYVPSEEDENAMRENIGVDQITEIFNKGMAINGLGPEAISKAKKHSELSEEH